MQDAGQEDEDEDAFLVVPQHRWTPVVPLQCPIRAGAANSSVLSTQCMSGELTMSLLCQLSRLVKVKG